MRKYLILFEATYTGKFPQLNINNREELNSRIGIEKHQEIRLHKYPDFEIFMITQKAREKNLNKSINIVIVSDKIEYKKNFRNLTKYIGDFNKQNKIEIKLKGEFYIHFDNINIDNNQMHSIGDFKIIESKKTSEFYITILAMIGTLIISVYYLCNKEIIPFIPSFVSLITAIIAFTKIIKRDKYLIEINSIIGVMKKETKKSEKHEGDEVDNARI